MSAAFENVTYDSILRYSNRNSLNFNLNPDLGYSLPLLRRSSGVGINKMILANNSSATRAEKNTRDHLRPKRARVYRVDVISSIAGYTTLPPTPFLERYKNAAGMCDGRRGMEGAINASNARAHERPEGSSRFQNAHVAARSSASAGLLWLLYEHRGYCYRCASCQPRFYLYLCSRVPATRDCAHPHTHGRASELLAWRTRGTSISISSTYFCNLGRFGDRWT